MMTNHDDHGDETLVSGKDPLDSLLREWHAENANRAAAQRDKLMSALAANAKHLSRERSESVAARINSSSPTEGGRYALSLKGERIGPRGFARFTPALAASLAFAVTLGLLFSTVGPQAQARADYIMAPDGGRLDAVNARGELIGPCPLRHTDVHVDVSGSFARVTLQQRYGNPYADKIEAVYTFPLSHRAAVDRMTMTIGDRVVVGEVKEREAARKTYEAAKSAGHAAALLEQERPNIFTQSVANIEPGVEIVVEISYVELLEARDGLFGFTFPMVVAPRYIPGGDDAGKALPDGLQHREGLNLLAPSTLTITANGDISQISVLTPEVVNSLITDAIPIEAPPAEYWTSHYPTTGQPAVWHQFELGYMDGQREAGVLYTDGLGQINGRWFYVNTGEHTWPPKAAAMPPGDDSATGTGSASGTQGTGFASGTSQVPDAARITPQPVKPPTRAGHDISITVNIDTGGPGITDLKSESHAVQQNWGGMRTDGTPSQVAVGLNEVATIPNKDFVLNWRQTADTINEQVFTHAGAHGGFITLILNPPARVENTDAVPRELVFVLDTSGSMQGFPIQKAKEVMTKAIAALRPQDTFNVITFAGDTHILWSDPQPATPDKLAEAQQFVTSREGRGGTEMMTAINAALTVNREVLREPEGAPTPVRIVCFLTDGEVGNDMAIIDAVKQNAATTRVFSFGIGNSVNRYLLDGIAKAGRGAAEYVLLSEGADEKVAAFTQRIQSPVLMNVKMEFAGDIDIVDGVSNGIDPTDGIGNTSSPAEGGRYAMQLPDLYDVSPVIVHARYTKGGKGSVTLRGDAGSGPYEKIIELDLPEAKAEHDVIATLWAREKVEQIMNRDLAAVQNGTFPDELKKQVIDLGETFQIMTQYTSFVAVENLRVTIGGQPRLVPVPIELPEGQSWEGTMGEAVNKWAEQIAPLEVVQLGQVLRIHPTLPQSTTGLAYPNFDSDSATSTEGLYLHADTLDGVPADSSTSEIAVYHLQHKTAYDIAFTLEELLKDKNGNGPTFDEGPNEKILIAKDFSPQQRETVRKLVEMFDVPTTESAGEGVFTLDADKVPADIAAKMLVDFAKASQTDQKSEPTASDETLARQSEQLMESLQEKYGISDEARKAIEQKLAGAPIDVSAAGSDQIVISATEADFQTINNILQDLDAPRGYRLNHASPSQIGATIERVLTRQLEQTSTSHVTTAEEIARAEETVSPWSKDALYPKNWAEISKKRDSAGSAAAQPHAFGMVAGQPNQPPPPQNRGREIILGQPVTPTGQPAELGEMQAGVTVNRYGLADSLAPTGSTQSFTRHQSVVAAAEGRQAGDDTRLRVGYIATPAPDPAVAAGEVVRRKLTSSAATAPKPSVTPGFIPKAPAAEYSTVDLDAGDEVVSSVGLGIPPAPTIGGVGGTIPDLNGDGVQDVYFGAEAYELNFPPPGVAPRFRGAWQGVGRGVTLGFPEPQAAEAETSNAPATPNLDLNDGAKVLTPEVAAATERLGNWFTVKNPLVDPSSSVAASIETIPDAANLQAELDKKNKELQDFRSTWSVLGQGAEPNEKLMTLESVVTELELDALGKEALWEQLKNFSPGQMPLTPEVQAALAKDPELARYQSDLDSAAAQVQTSREKYGSQHRAVGEAEDQYARAKQRLDEERAVKTLTLTNHQISRAQQNYLRAQEMLLKANDQLAKVKAEQRDKDSKMAEYLTLVKERDALRARVERENRTGAAIRMQIDQLLVRAASLVRSGRMEAALAVTHAILEAQPDLATAKAMHEVLSSGVLTPQSIAMRVCQLAADAAHRLAASAERARLMARRLDERLLRLAVGDASIRTPRGNGGTAASDAHAAPADPGAPGPVAPQPPVAPHPADGLDMTDKGVLVSVLVDAFGDGTAGALTASGLAIESIAKPARTAIGRIAPGKLADLATCKHVRKVEAVKAR